MSPTTTLPSISDDVEGSFRGPVWDETAEQCALGGMLLSASALAEVVELVRASDFYRPAHHTIFETICGLFASGEPVDPVTVADALSKSGLLLKVGGAPYLHTLIAAVPTAANASYYARIVGERATLRRLIEAGTRIVQLGYGTTAGNGPDIDDAAVTAEQILLDATDRGHGRDVRAAAELLKEALDNIEAAGTGRGLTGLATGLDDLDHLTGGLQPGQLVVVAGRPGMGKSVMGLDLARHAAIRVREPVLIASLEMSEQELMNRLLSAESGVPLHCITHGDLTDGDWAKIARAAGKIGDAPLWIDASARATLLDIRAKARRLAAVHGGLGLLVIDYLQLMGSTRHAETREREVAEISRGLKLLAKDLGCPVIAISQLNRAVEQRSDKRPLLSDLRESGALEADADLVLLLYREDYYDRESPRAGEVDIDVAKHRGGPTATFTAVAQLHLARFASFALPEGSQ